MGPWWSLVNPNKKLPAYIICQIHLNPCISLLLPQRHSSSWNVTSVLSAMLFCSDILSHFWIIIWEPCCLMHIFFPVFRFHDEPHAWQTNHTWPSLKDTVTIGHSGFRWGLLWNQNTACWNESLPSPVIFLQKIHTGWLGVSTQLWDWHHCSHLITLRGIWEVSSIMWSGAIK